MEDIPLREKLGYLMKTEGITQIIQRGIEITSENIDGISEKSLKSALLNIEELYKKSYGKEVDCTGLSETNSFKNPNFHIFLS